ncbi:nuclear transport factor 2 family protein [Sphingomonas paeninsulae]|uniref:Nuclear transport factor 2 family protein n=1 Tax=Sphingomonas paeninsulae TaxID=2319844 RepID=A0A494TPL4_SPHPE|nr:nuclear transport factor 2 family protein [Sphingomonas paeninsulae]AYJ87736.1 nuclear transport factor 2 family protein [Sphingomonas paeninsulae]
MTVEANRDLFVTMLNALGRKDYDTFEACLADDILLEWPFPVMDGFPTEHRGARWFREALETSWVDFDPYAYQIEAIHMLTDPGTLVAEYSSHSRYLPTSTPYSNRYVSVVDIANGRIVRWREYVNPSIVAAILGQKAVWKESSGATVGLE